MYDVTVIGAGVVGAMTARELTKYDLSVCILEKENDVAMGATKANSAIVHAGFDAETGSLKAKLNVKGSEMMPQITKELGVKYKNNGAFVIGFDENDKEVINELYNRGVANGVKNLEILGYEEIHNLEPNVSENVKYALYAPTSGIICPYELTIAAVGNAMDNGAHLMTDFNVTKIEKSNGIFKIFSEERFVESKIVINAAGLYSDEIAAMAGDNSVKITPRRGEYILLDKESGDVVSHTVFRTPSKLGKGILISPTVDGNLLLGPTSVDIDCKENKDTTQEGFAKIIGEALMNVDKINIRQAITSFCGLRAVGNTGDFIINSPFEGFINLAGIESPGLSASPAIAEYVAQIINEQMCPLEKNEKFNPYRKPMDYFRSASVEEKNEIIKKDKAYGKIVCRCETVTEGEIRNAIRTNPRPSDLDGVKRRTRAQMGRCQGGFCVPYITKILAEELNIPVTAVTKSGEGSYINISRTKEER